MRNTKLHVRYTLRIYHYFGHISIYAICSQSVFREQHIWRNINNSILQTTDTKNTYWCMDMDISAYLRKHVTPPLKGFIHIHTQVLPIFSFDLAKSSHTKQAWIFIIFGWNDAVACGHWRQGSKVKGAFHLLLHFCIMDSSKHHREHSCIYCDELRCLKCQIWISS